MGGSVSTLERIYASWAQGDFRTPVALLDEPFEYEAGPGIPDRGVWYGLAGLADYTRYFLSSWKDLRIEALGYEPVGHRVLVHVRQAGLGSSSGVPTEWAYFHVWTFEGGRPVRLQAVGEEAMARAITAGSASA